MANGVVWKITSKIPNHHATITANCEYMDQKVKHNEKPADELSVKGGGWLAGLPDPVWASVKASSGTGCKHPKVVVSFSQETKEEMTRHYIDFDRATEYIIKMAMLDWGKEFYPLWGPIGFVYGAHSDTDNLHYHLIIPAVGGDNEKIELVGRITGRDSKKTLFAREFLKKHVDEILSSNLGDLFLDEAAIKKQLERLELECKNKKKNKLLKQINEIKEVLEEKNGNLIEQARRKGMAVKKLMAMDNQMAWTEKSAKYQTTGFIQVDTSEMEPYQTGGTTRVAPAAPPSAQPAPIKKPTPELVRQIPEKIVEHEVIPEIAEITID